MAKIQIEPQHADHFDEIGIPRESHPTALDVHDDEYESVRESWKEALPRADHETLHMKTMGTLAWRRHSAGASVSSPSAAPPVAAEGTHHQELLRLVKAAVWLGSVALFLLLCLLAATVLAPRAHGQFSKINSVDVRNNDNSAQAFITSPFTFKAGANCSFANSGTTLTLNCSGGAAGAGGLTSQIQWNSTGSLAGISSLTTDGTITTALAGVDWLFADLTTPTKKFQFDASNISAVTTRTVNIPDANSTTAQAIAAVSHKFITQMSAQGVFTLAQPACADISDAGVFCSGTAYSSLTGAPTLPVTIANASHKWLNSYTSGTGAFTQTQPDYSDLTGTPTLPANTTATASNFFTAYNSSTGAFTKAQPAYSDVSGTLALASAVFANQGSTTTVLHGNAAGNPSFAAVSISADVSGLGTGVATFLATPSSANFFSAITDEIGNGSKAVKMDSVSGTGTALATTTGALTNTHCVNIDANSNLVDSGAVCGGGSGTLATLTVGTASGGPSFSASTTYWLGQIQHSPTTTYADEAVMVPTTGTGTVDLACSFAIGGTASAGNVAFSVCTGAAGGTCTASTNMSMASRNVNFSATGLTLTPTAGSLIAVKAVTPAWATGASSTFGVCYIVIH